MQNLSFSFSNPPNCRENLASMNDKADERRQHITDTTLFSQTFFFYLFILFIFVQVLDTFMTAWAWQMYSFDHFKHVEKNLKVIRLVQNNLFCKKIIVFNQDLF